MAEAIKGISPGAQPQDVKLSPDGTGLYVSGRRAGAVSVVSFATAR